MKHFIAFVAALAASTPASARDTVADDGNELLSLCSSTDYFSSGMCLGYVRGISATSDVMMALNNKKLCYPSSMTFGQLRDVVLSYIRRNPSTRHYSSTLLYLYAVQEAWPCK